MLHPPNPPGLRRSPDIKRRTCGKASGKSSTLVPFVVAWYLAYRALSVSCALTLALAAIGAGFMMRLFIIQHDCGHGSFFKSKTANDIVGSVIGVHHIHHLSPRTPNYLLQKCYDENPRAAQRAARVLDELAMSLFESVGRAATKAGELSLVPLHAPSGVKSHHQLTS